MITGQRLSELFYNGMKRNIDEQQRVEWVELLSGYQKFNDYRLALSELRCNFMEKITQGKKTNQAEAVKYLEGLVKFIDHMLME